MTLLQRVMRMQESEMPTKEEIGSEIYFEQQAIRSFLPANLFTLFAAALKTCDKPIHILH